VVQDYQAPTDAWWALRADVMWALDGDTAQMLLLGVKDR
jgi:hypothetical protein